MRQPASVPEDLDVVELHDCFAHNELITYEALGLCPEGEAEPFMVDGDNTYGGRYVTNPSGGLLSKGHPLGATGLAQCFELTHQLRGAAEQRAGATAPHSRCSTTSASAAPAWSRSTAIEVSLAAAIPGAAGSWLPVSP